MKVGPSTANRFLFLFRTQDASENKQPMLSIQGMIFLPIFMVQHQHAQ
jgi:hypothetical protein